MQAVEQDSEVIWPTQTTSEQWMDFDNAIWQRLFTPCVLNVSVDEIDKRLSSEIEDKEIWSKV